MRITIPYTDMPGRSTWIFPRTTTRTTDEKKDHHRIVHHLLRIPCERGVHRLRDRNLHEKARRPDPASPGRDPAGALPDPDQKRADGPHPEGHGLFSALRHRREERHEHGDVRRYLLRLPSQHGNHIETRFIESKNRGIRESAEQGLYHPRELPENDGGKRPRVPGRGGTDGAGRGDDRLHQLESGGEDGVCSHSYPEHTVG